jgi:LacI family transcriptional regulator
MHTKRPTISDVAEKAGVSKATVSAVLNDRTTVRESTREEVLAAMRLLDYRPDPLARRRSVGGRSRTVGFLLREIANPYYGEIITGAEEFLREHGYTMLVGASEGDARAEHRIVDVFGQKSVDGLLLTPVRNYETDLAHIFELKRRNVSFVLLEAIHGVQANLVDVDTVAGTKEAVRHLIELGHTQLVHFGGPHYSLHSDERISGVRAAYSESSLIFSQDAVVRAGDSLADGYRAGLEYFRSCPAANRPTAITCYNDLVALGVCRALAEVGLEVPGDVSVVGYDDLPLLEYVTPRLTSVRVPKREVGRRAAEILHREISTSAPRAPQKIYLETELVIRQSTAPPQKR